MAEGDALSVDPQFDAERSLSVEEELDRAADERFVRGWRGRYPCRPGGFREDHAFFKSDLSQYFLEIRLF